MNIESELFQVDYLKSVIDAMSDMVRVITKEGRVALTNESYDRKMANGGNTVGQRCYEVFYENECDACVCREALATGRMQQVTRRYGDRMYSVTISPIRNSEGENFAAVEVFRDMTLDYNIKQNLLTQNAKMQRDLQMARNLQQALMKNVLPVLDGFELYAGFFPCEAVGGDIFDCMQFGNKLIMYVADVSGHGVMPSMLAVFFSRAVRTACSLGKLSPSDILDYVQQEYLGLDLADSIYITGFVVVLDITTGKFAYANAGLSVVPILFDGEVQELYMSAPPISTWFEKPTFYDAEHHLPLGGRLLIYSDGIRDVQSNQAVKDELYRYFCKDSFSCEEFIGDVKRELHTRPEDDLTLLICKREG